MDIGLAVGDDDHLRAGQLSSSNLRRVARRPFDLDALGIPALDIEFVEERLNLAIEHRVFAALVCRPGAKLFDLGLDGALPTAQEALHHGSGEKSKAGRDADEGESEKVALRRALASAKVRSCKSTTCPFLSPAAMGNRLTR